MADPDVVRDLLRYRDVLMGFILVLVRDHDLAEDVFQDVAVSILGEAHKGVRPRAFMPWARALARHRVADHFRRHSRRQGREVALETMAEVADQAFAEHGPSAEQSRERVKFLRECLERLAGRARAVIDGRYHDRKSLAEIAASIGWKVASVKVALSKARKALAECVSRKQRAKESMQR